MICAMRTYRRKLDDIDPEKGNCLLLYLEDAKTLIGAGQDVAMRLIYALTAWFCNADCEMPLSGSLEGSFLQMLKEKQRDNVRGYIAKCSRRLSKAQSTDQVTSQPEAAAESALAPTKEPPTWETVLTFARDAVHKPNGKPIPEATAKEWFDIMSAGGWKNTRGNSVLYNWRQNLIYFAKREKSFASEKSKPRQTNTALHTENYKLHIKEA